VPISKLAMQLNNSKSTNLNLWIFQQKFKFKYPGTYLKYSIGMEMFNFRYEHPINYRKEEVMTIFLGDSTYNINKLVTTYISARIQFGYHYKLKNNKTIGKRLIMFKKYGDETPVISFLDENGEQKFCPKCNSVMSAVSVDSSNELICENCELTKEIIHDDKTIN
jgi:hypothetical protein